MSNLGSESEVLDLEKGKGGGSDPKTASALTSASATVEVEHAAAVEPEKDTDTDPRKVRLVNFAVVVFCVAAIVVFVYIVYSMYNDTVPFWEAFGYCALYFVLCVGTILMVRKALISIFAAARPPAAARPAAARRAAATTVARLCTCAAPTATVARLCTCAAPTATAARPGMARSYATSDPIKLLFGLP